MASTKNDGNKKIDNDLITENSIQIQSEKNDNSPFKKIWRWLISSRQRFFSLIFLILFIGLMIALGFAKQDPTHLMLDIVWWFQNHTGNLGLYIGVGIISIFGNFVMFIPVLYAAVLMFVAFLDVNIFLLGVAAGLGASIGQIASWFVGRATREIASEKLEKQLRKTQRWVDLGIVPLIIFIFAATPLPDEVVLIMIGLVGYSLAKTLFFCFIGKMVLTLSLSYLAHYFSRTLVGNWLLDFLFGLTIENLENQVLPTDNNIWTSIAVWIIAASMVVLVAFVDWVEIFDKRKCRREQEQLTKIIRINKNKNPHLTTSNIEDIERINDNSLSIRIYSQQKVELFPEESLWFLEETISSKKKTILRKSLIDVSAILGKQAEINLNGKWLENFRKNLNENRYNKMKKTKMNLVKIPNNALTNGFIPSNSRLISYSIKLINIINSTNLKEVFLLYDFSKLDQIRFLRQKVQFEVLLETIKDDSTRIWAIGIKEGTYINKIKQYEKSLVLFFWLRILNSVVNNPSGIQNLVIYNLDPNLDTELKKELIIPPDLLQGCPI